MNQKPVVEVVIVYRKFGAGVHQIIVVIIRAAFSAVDVIVFVV